jgi:hypothetical protein
MARQVVFRQTSGNKASIDIVPINLSKNSSNHTDQAIKQIQQTTDQANGQILSNQIDQASK